MPVQFITGGAAVWSQMRCCRRRQRPFTLNHLSAGVRPFFLFCSLFWFLSLSLSLSWLFSFNLRQIDEQQSWPRRPLSLVLRAARNRLFYFFTCEADGAFSLSPSLQRNAPISCIYIYNEPDL